MKIVKKITSLLFLIALFISSSIYVMAAEPSYERVKYTEDSSMQLQYLNISTTMLSCDETWIAADCSVKTKMNIKITVKVYKNGSLVDTFSESGYGRFAGLDVDYDFEKGAS